MSAYSEWKCGAIGDDEYRSAMARECQDLDPYDRFTCCDCSSYKDCQEQVARLGYPQCEQGENKFDDEIEVYEALQDEAFLMANYGWTNTEDILRDFSLVDIQADYKDWMKTGDDLK